MDPLAYIQQLGGGILATICVVEAIVIVYLAKRLEASHQTTVEMLVQFGKERREELATTAQSMNTNTHAIQLNTEVLRQVASVRGDR